MTVFPKIHETHYDHATKVQYIGLPESTIGVIKHTDTNVSIYIWRYGELLNIVSIRKGNPDVTVILNGIRYVVTFNEMYDLGIRVVPCSGWGTYYYPKDINNVLSIVSGDVKKLQVTDTGYWPTNQLR